MQSQSRAAAPEAARYFSCIDGFVFFALARRGPNKRNNAAGISRCPSTFRASALGRPMDYRPGLFGSFSRNFDFSRHQGRLPRPQQILLLFSEELEISPGKPHRLPPQVLPLASPWPFPAPPTRLFARKFEFQNCPKKHSRGSSPRPHASKAPAILCPHPIGYADFESISKAPAFGIL